MNGDALGLKAEWLPTEERQSLREIANRLSACEQITYTNLNKVCRARGLIHLTHHHLRIRQTLASNDNSLMLNVQRKSYSSLISSPDPAEPPLTPPSPSSPSSPLLTPPSPSSPLLFSSPCALLYPSHLYQTNIVFNSRSLLSESGGCLHVSEGYQHG